MTETPDLELIKTNAILSDAKFNNILRKFTSLERKIEGEKIIYLDNGQKVMEGVYYPLFEVHGEGIRMFLDMPAPKNEDEKNAMLALLYTKFFFIDVLVLEKQTIYVGLNNVKMEDTSVASFGLDANEAESHKECKSEQESVL